MGFACKIPNRFPYLVTGFITNPRAIPEPAGQHGAALYPSEKRALPRKKLYAVALADIWHLHLSLTWVN